MHSIDHYIKKRRNSIAEYVGSREVFKLCKRSKAKRGSGHNTAEGPVHTTYNTDRALAAS